MERRIGNKKSTVSIRLYNKLSYLRAFFFFFSFCYREVITISDFEDVVGVHMHTSQNKRYAIGFCQLRPDQRPWFSHFKQSTYIIFFFNRSPCLEKIDFFFAKNKYVSTFYCIYKMFRFIIKLRCLRRSNNVPTFLFFKKSLLVIDCSSRILRVCPILVQ